MTEKQKLAQNYLNQAFKADRQINLDIEKLEAMESSLRCRGINYESDGSQHNPNGNSVENAILKVMEYKEKINKEIDRLVDLKLEIENVINAVEDDAQREILTRRYILFHTWDGYYDKESEKYVKGIYDEVNYSRSRAFQIHRTALDCIELH